MASAAIINSTPAAAVRAHQELSSERPRNTSLVPAVVRHDRYYGKFTLGCLPENLGLGRKPPGAGELVTEEAVLKKTAYRASRGTV
jgi:hypothetical protein